MLETNDGDDFDGNDKLMNIRMMMIRKVLSRGSPIHGHKVALSIPDVQKIKQIFHSWKLTFNDKERIYCKSGLTAKIIAFQDSMNF